MASNYYKPDMFCKKCDKQLSSRSCKNMLCLRCFLSQQKMTPKQLKAFLKNGKKTRFKSGHKCMPGSEKGWFKKGEVPKTSWKKGDNAWNKNPQWNPLSTNYSTMHQRIRKLLGTPSKCEFCGSTNSKRYEWANTTGNYNNFSEYKRLCKKCHIKFDNQRRIK